MGMVVVACWTARIWKSLDDNDVHVQTHQVGGEVSPAIQSPRRPAVFDMEVFALNPAEGAQLL